MNVGSLDTKTRVISLTCDSEIHRVVEIPSSLEKISGLKASALDFVPAACAVSSTRIYSLATRTAPGGIKTLVINDGGKNHDLEFPIDTPISDESIEIASSNGNNSSSLIFISKDAAREFARRYNNLQAGKLRNMISALDKIKEDIEGVNRSL